MKVEAPFIHLIKLEQINQREQLIPTISMDLWNIPLEAAM